MLSMLLLHLAAMPVSCSHFKKLVQSLQFPTFTQKFLTKFVLLHYL